jgi:hypothetical protein
MTNRTLITGWWGTLAFFTNFETIALNVIAMWAFRNVEAPQPPTIPVRAPRSLPLNPGKSLFRRAGIYFATAVLVTLILVGLNWTHSHRQPGRALPGIPVAGSTLTLVDRYIPDAVIWRGGHDTKGTVVESFGGPTRATFNDFSAQIAKSEEGRGLSF